MKTVLIVDDNAVFREKIASYLCSRLEGYTVVAVENGEMAIEALEAHDVGLVLTDLMMPKVDGYAVVAYLKKNHPSLPVIIMTSAWSLELNQLIRKLGMVLYVEKPFHLEELNQLIIEPLNRTSKALLRNNADAR